jgi:RND family efflux transporter MFP subunit
MAQTPSIDDLRIDRSEATEGSGTGRWIVGIPIVLVLLALGGWWLRGALGVPSVAVVEARGVTQGGEGSSGRFSSSVLDASGYVVARRRATVSSKITAKVVEVRVEEGMRVQEGQILAVLDDSTPLRQQAWAAGEGPASRAAVQEARALLPEAELNLERARRLAASDVGTQAALDSAQAQVDALKAGVEAAAEQVTVAQRRLALRQQELADTRVLAPFDGVAISKDAQPGEMVSPVSAGGGFTRTGISTIVDMDSLEIEVDVNEAYIGRVFEGQPVQATLDAYPDWKIPGSVIIAVPTADRQKATVKVRIRFQELDPRILPDMGVKVAFLEREAPAAPDGTVSTPRARTEVRIPASAVRQEEGRAVVYVLQGKAVERRGVTLGREEAGEVAVASGLEAGERVVVEPPAGLADGDKVKVITP